MKIKTIDMIAEGNKIVALSEWTATHTGADYLGNKATGKTATYPVVTIYEFKDGKLINGMVLGNTESAYKQFGWKVTIGE
jgi:predicted ester cyclase